MAIFGVAQAALAQTWEAGPPAGPTARCAYGLAYDSARGRVVLFGGRHKQGLAPDGTWELDGATWSGPTSSPPSRYWPGMAYHPDRGVVVLVGGTFGLPYGIDEGWVYDGVTWQPFPPHSEAIFGASMTYDASTRWLVRVGGCTYHDCETGVGLLGPTGDWQAGATPPDGGPYALQGFAHDARRGTSVLAGNMGGSGPESTVWEGDGQSWSEAAPLPYPNGCFAMAYDPGTGRVVMFGGGSSHVGGSTFRDETWEYDGMVWFRGAQAPPALGPRGDVSMVYSAEVGGIVLFGGEDDVVVHDDTWFYRGGASCTLDISPVSLPQAFAGVPYAVQLTAVDGSAPLGWTLLGSLPDGLALDGASGVIAGTPTRATTTTFAVHVVDAQRCTGNRSYVLAVTGGRSCYIAGEGAARPRGNRVRLFDDAGVPSAIDFPAYGAGHWGTRVSSGRLDGQEQLVTGPGPGEVHGPHVRAFARDGTPLAKVSFFAYGTLRFGASVGVARLDGDAFDEILSGAGPGAIFGPHVRGFDYDGNAVDPRAGVSFFAYPTLRYGVEIGAGSLDAGTDEILTGPGPGPTFGATIRGFDVESGVAEKIPSINFDAFPTTHGVVVGSGDLEGDPYGEILAATGPAPTNPVRLRGFRWDGSRIEPIFDAEPLLGSYGGRVASGDLVTGDREEIVAAAGPDPSVAAEVHAFTYDGALSPVPGTPFAAFTGSYGANVAVGAFDP